MAYQEVKFEFPDPDKDDTIDIEIEPSSETAILDKAGNLIEQEDADQGNDDGDDSSKSEVGGDADGDGSPAAVEIVDDRPPEDRDRTPSKSFDEPTEDELSEYSSKVQKRIKQITKNAHDERRAKEDMERKSNELEKYTRALVEENKRLKRGTTKSNTALLEQAKLTVEGQIDAARKDYREALDSGDSEQILKAEEVLSTARMKKMRIDSLEVPAAPEEESAPVAGQTDDGDVQQPQRVTQEPQVDRKAEQWVKDNPWFNTNKSMNGFALGYHQELVESGVDPRTDEYYEKLNSRMREVFPGEFEEELEKPPVVKSVVARPDRGSSPKKVKVTRTQAAMAKNLGVPIEEYAKQVALLGSKN